MLAFIQTSLIITNLRFLGFSIYRNPPTRFINRNNFKLIFNQNKILV